MTTAEIMAGVGIICFAVGALLMKIILAVFFKRDDNGNGNKREDAKAHTAEAVAFGQLQTAVEIGFSNAQSSRDHLKDDIKYIKNNMVTTNECETRRQLMAAAIKTNRNGG